MTIACARTAILTLSLLAEAAIGTCRAEPRVFVAQGTVTIPTDAQLERMARDSIATPPLDVSEGAQRAGQRAQTRQTDKRDRRNHQKTLKHRRG
jgi:hypothetical protein